MLNEGYMYYIKYIKMPAPLMVLGVMYFLYAVLHFIECIKIGYWNGVISSLILIIKKHYIRFLLMLGVLILVIMYVDLPVAILIKKLYNLEFYTIVDFFCSMGEGWFVGGVIFTLFLISNFLGNYNNATVYKISFMITIYAGILNALAKFFISRERPNINMNPHHFFQFFINESHNINNIFYSYNSMPSGHTITVFAAITPLFLYTNKIFYKIILILSGLIIGFARVYTLNHWLSDVILSAFLGITIGYIGYTLNLFRLSNKINSL